MNAQLQTQAKEHAKSLFMPAPSGLLQRKCGCANHTVAGGECEECSKKKRLALQTKLKISEPGDIYEQEADRIADQVTVTTARHAVRDAPPWIQRFLGHPNGRMDAAPASVDHALASPGRPLEPALRHDMEQHFGHDFSKVRVHSGAAADQSAQDVNARAYTVGQDMVFGAAQFAPGMHEGRRLIAHELTHVVQQAGPDAAQRGSPPILIQREPDKSPPKKDSAKKPPADKTPKSAGVTLSQTLLDLANKNVKDYVTYKEAIAKSTAKEKQAALNPSLLTKLKDTLDHLSFARCVEALGRKAPTFAELRKNSVVAQAIKDAWQASDVGTRDLVTQPHEEGGWVFMNLIDGSLSIERAKAEGTDFIKVEPPPDVENSVLVAIFHTHPQMGPKAGPSPADKKEDERRGVPNLVAANKGNKPDVFDIFLSGPTVRKHLASDTKIPGRSGGVAP